jgi:membrane associated rhomboid family serine protease
MSDEQQPPKTSENQEVEGRQPIFLVPGVVTALIGLMAAIQLADSFVFNNETRELFTIWFAFIPVRLLDPTMLPGGLLPLLWTPFTHAFLHAGFEHLIMNCAWLAIFATPMARRYGTVPTLILFLASAVVGALAFAATTLPGIGVLLGASGGVAGLTGAAMRFIFQPVIVARDEETGRPVVLGRKLASLREMWANSQARTFTLFWVILNAAVPLLPLVIGSDISVAWQAHLGGFFTGLLLVPLFERNTKTTEMQA